MGIESRAATASGACLCGAVRFTVRLPTLFCGHCHCTMCQRGHGAAYVTWFGVVRDQFVIDAGEDSLLSLLGSDPEGSPITALLGPLWWRTGRRSSS